MHVLIKENEVGHLIVGLTPLLKAYVTVIPVKSTTLMINANKSPTAAGRAIKNSKTSAPPSALASLSISQVADEEQREVNEWKEKAVCLIHAYFKKFRTGYVNKVSSKRGAQIVSECNKLVMTKGKLIKDRMTIVRVFYSDTTSRMRILLCDMDTRISQTFILDNFSYLEMTQDEFQQKMIKIIDKIEYNEEKGEYAIGIEDTPKEEGNIIGIVPLSALDETHEKEDHKDKPEDPQKKDQVYTSVPQWKEIYKGVKKLGNDYYCVQVNLSNQKKAEIVVNKDGKAEKTTIEVKTELKEFLGLNPGDEGQIKLGRMIYNGLCFNDQNILYFNDTQLKEAIIQYAFKDRSQRLTKMQSRFRICIAKKKVDLIKELHRKQLILIFQFGLRIGTKYHMIKVIEDVRKKNKILLRSDKATNTLEINLIELGIVETTDSCTYKSTLKAILTSKIAYDKVKNLIVIPKKARKKSDASVMPS